MDRGIDGGMDALKPLDVLHLSWPRTGALMVVITLGPSGRAKTGAVEFLAPICHPLYLFDFFLLFTLRQVAPATAASMFPGGKTADKTDVLLADTLVLAHRSEGRRRSVFGKKRGCGLSMSPHQANETRRGSSE